MIAAASRKVPFDYAETVRMPGWRESLAWPLSHAGAFAAGRTSIRAFLGFVNGLEDESHRRIVLLAGGRIAAVGRALTEAALCVQEETRRGIRFIGGPAELSLLRGEPPAIDVKFWHETSPFKPMASPRWIWPRRVARMASFTSLWRLPSVLLRPTVTAITHNALLCAVARRSKERVGFLHAEILLAETRRRNGVQPKRDITHLADGTADVLSCVEGLDEPYAGRLRSLLLPMIKGELEKAAGDLEALAAIPSLPSALWAGTGGYYPSRAIGIEVRRRGGTVTRFGHGGISALTDVIEPAAFTELAVCDRFITETRSGALNLTTAEAGTLVDRYSRPEIEGADGIPGLDRLPLTSDRRPARRTVIYPSTIFRSFRQFFPPSLPDVMYLDWQLRLVEMLRGLPVDLLCKPHPEGLLRGKPHPLASLAPTSTRRFEDVMGEADVFLLDYAQSTPFYVALCTDRPVVFIDMGNPLFSPKVRTMLERRCRIVKARFDDRNRPHVQPDELEEAICGGSDRADPSEFQALLMENAGVVR